MKAILWVKAGEIPTDLQLLDFPAIFYYTRQQRIAACSLSCVFFYASIAMRLLRAGLLLVVYASFVGPATAQSGAALAQQTASRGVLSVTDQRFCQVQARRGQTQLAIEIVDGFADELP